MSHWQEIHYIHFQNTHAYINFIVWFMYKQNSKRYCRDIAPIYQQWSTYIKHINITILITCFRYLWIVFDTRDKLKSIVVWIYTVSPQFTNKMKPVVNSFYNFTQWNKFAPLSWISSWHINGNSEQIIYLNATIFHILSRNTVCITWPVA